MEISKKTCPLGCAAFGSLCERSDEGMEECPSNNMTKLDPKRRRQDALNASLVACVLVLMNRVLFASGPSRASFDIIVQRKRQLRCCHTWLSSLTRLVGATHNSSSEMLSCRRCKEAENHHKYSLGTDRGRAKTNNCQRRRRRTRTYTCNSRIIM